MNIRTAYGSVSPTGGTESQFRDKLSLASRVSNLLSVRNSRFKEFIKELNLLLEKYENFSNTSN